MNSKTKRFLRRGLSIILTICMLIPMLIVGNVSVSANPIKEKVIDQLIEDGMRACCIGMDYLGESTGNGNVQKAFSIVESWALMSAEEVAIEELMELCEEILEELAKIDDHIDSSMSVVDSMVSKDIIETAKTAVSTQWDADVQAPINNAKAEIAFDSFKSFIAHALSGEKTKEELEKERDELIEDMYGMYNGNSQLGVSHEETMFSGDQMNKNYEHLIKQLAQNLDKSNSVMAKSIYFAYMAYPFSHQQYTYVYNMAEKQLLYLMIVEMMYNEYLYRQGQFLENTEGYGVGSDAYQAYSNYQKSFYDLMLTDDNCVAQYIVNMLSSKVTVDTTNNVSLSLDSYMKPEDVVSVPLTIQDYEKSHDFWDEAVDMAKAYDDDWTIRKNTNVSKADHIKETVWCKRVMTHSMYGNKVFYILDSDKLDTDALNVRNYKNKIDLKGYKDTHTPTCDYINLIKDMSDGVNTFATADAYDCSSLKPLFAPNAFKANGNMINNYLSGLLPTKDGNNYVLTPMRRYNSSKWGLKTAYVKYKVLSGSKEYSGNVAIDNSDGKDEVDTSAFDSSDENYINDRFTVLLANKSNTYKQYVHAETLGSVISEIRIYADGVSNPINAGGKMQVESGKMLTIKMKCTGYPPEKLTLKRNGDDTSTVTLLEASDFDNLTVDSEGYYVFSYPMPYSDAVFTLVTPQFRTASVGTVTYGTGSFSKDNDNAISATCTKGETVYCYFTGDQYYTTISMPEFRDARTNQKISVKYEWGDYYQKNGRQVYEIFFTMPDKDITVSAEFGGNKSHTATIDSFAGGTASFSRTKDEKSQVIGEYLWTEMYITIPADHCISALSITDTSGRNINFSRSGNTTYEGNNKTIPISFQMVDHDITITGSAEKGYEVSADSTAFCYDESGEPTAYIELKDYSDNNNYTTDTFVVATYTSTLEGRFVYDNKHYPMHIRIVGLDTGKVYYDRDKDNDATTFICMNDNMEAFTENVIVIPTFGETKTNVTIGEFTDCTASFETGSAVTEKVYSEGEEVTFYVTASYASDGVNVSATDSSGKDCGAELIGYAPSDNRHIIYIYSFTMPDSNVTITGSLIDSAKYNYIATIGEITNGAASFNTEERVETSRHPQYEYVNFYVRTQLGYTFTDLKVTTASGKPVPFQKAADNVIQDDKRIFILKFQMPGENVTIQGELESSFTAAPDTTQFRYNDSGEPEAYIELKDYVNNNEYTTDPIQIASYMTAVNGRFVYSGNYYPTHLKVTGQDTGTVFYDKDVDASATTFICMTADNTPFGENILVIPTFEKVAAPEPVARDLGIRTYEELAEFAENVKNDYRNYGSANVWLENNILAPDDSKWTVSIGSLDAPFEGTFDGRGYGIVGLNVDIEDFGGLFGVIGENGTVKDLAVIDCDFSKKSEYAGGIAAVNNGTIDHCLSGINMDPSVKIYGRNGKRLRLDEYNSYVKGNYSGGIAAVNNGTITGTRNGAFVDGANGGGIAAENNGTIYGSANNGAIGRDSLSVLACGGIACRNSGTISCCYNSGKPTGSSSTQNPSVLAMIAATNASENISDVFCNNINSIPAFGSTSTVSSDEKVTVLNNSSMLEPSFAATLNSVTDDSVQWDQKIINGTYLNSMYPIILGNFLRNKTLSLSSGIEVSGLMHASLNVYYSPLESSDEIYTAIDDSVDLEIAAVYGVSCDDGNGVYIPAEFWCSGVTVSVPVSSDDVSIAVLSSDGSVQIIEPEIKEGIASFQAAAPVSFAVVKTTSSSADNGNNDSGNNPVPTGDSPAAAAAFAAVIFSAAVIAFTRRRRIRE